MNALEMSPADPRVIAGRAGGLEERTVCRYLEGANTQPKKRRAIEKALRDLGMTSLVRKTKD